MDARNASLVNSRQHAENVWMVIIKMNTLNHAMNAIRLVQLAHKDQINIAFLVLKVIMHHQQVVII